MRTSRNQEKLPDGFKGRGGRHGHRMEKSISKVSELQEGKKGVYTDKLACGVQSQIRRERCLSGEEVAVDM